MNKYNLKRRRVRGFTLLEMMVVVMIIGLLAAMVVPNLLRNKDRANQKKAQSDIVALESALDLYYLDHNRYPDNSEGLNALTAKDDKGGGYLKRLPQDPWGRAYQYLSPGQYDRIDIYSWGEDGQQGGTAAAADIGNWNVGEF